MEAGDPAQRPHPHPSQITVWEVQLPDPAPQAVGTKAAEPESSLSVKKRETKIDDLPKENGDVPKSVERVS